MLSCCELTVANQLSLWTVYSQSAVIFNTDYVAASDKKTCRIPRATSSFCCILGLQMYSGLPLVVIISARMHCRL